MAGIIVEQKRTVL